MTLVGLALFSVLGTFLRYTVDRFFSISSPESFPWNTFTINVAGSFLIGCVFILASEKGILSETWGLILITGFLGSFTTFSAFSMQNYLLIQNGRIDLAAIYSASSVLVGLSAVFLGTTCGRFLIKA